MTNSRFPSPSVIGHRDRVADLAPILAEASSRDCTPPLRELAQDEPEIVGVSPAMTRLRMQVQRIGPHFRAVVVSGEAGTGKELAARALHRLSQRAAGPFVVCHAGKPSTKGFDRTRTAASSAEIDRMLMMAQGGTLFFDGISEMPLEAQTHLLRVLRRQDGYQVGSGASQKMDLRMIAATREDLRVLASAGRFLQELYQRLAMVEIALPPLRERREDIPHLATHFLARMTLRFGKGFHKIAEDAMQRLEAHPWPGNVRELERTMRHSIQQSAGGVLEITDLPELEQVNAVESGTTDAFETVRLQEVVERHVHRVLKNCAGNKLRAAEMLGISRSTLYRMLDASSYAGGATIQGRDASEVNEERYTR
jgi:DNA-binding NtrC family response regulator